MSDVAASQPIVELRGIRKSFGPFIALDGADFAAYPGEVTALVGDNGSGKSTLIKTLTGYIAPDSGTIVVRGREHARLTPRRAIEEGIGVVYQDLALDDEKSCAENIFLGREIVRGGVFLDRRAMRRRARELLDSLGIDIPDVDQKVSGMSGGQRQALAIARTMCFPHDILVFDEPTSAMGMRETDRAMGLFRRLRDDGKSVILISHNLFQVFDIADRISVMSHGRVVESFLAKDSTPQQLWDSIVLRESAVAREPEAEVACERKAEVCA